MTKKKQISEPDKAHYKEGLNNGQSELFDLLEAFCTTDTEENDKMFCIKGYAGTGKTYVITRFFSYLLSLKKYKRSNVCLTAPTNKAVAVLKSSTKKDEKNMFGFDTIHKLLGVKSIITDDGREIFKANDIDKTIMGYDFVVIDETSMLSDELFFDLLKSIGYKGYKSNSFMSYRKSPKIIFMGDPKQIPPVGKIDCEPFLNPVKYGIDTYELTQIMRQKDGNMIIEASYMVRQNIDKPYLDFTKFHNGTQVDVVNTAIENNRIALVKHFEDVFSSEKFKADPSSIKAIAWTNEKVDSYNKFIRKIYFGDISSEQFVVGDSLIANKPIIEENYIVLNNATEMKVLEVNKKNFYIICNSINTIKPINVNGFLLNIEYFDVDADKMVKYEIRVLSENYADDFKLFLNAIAQSAKATNDSRNRKLRWEEFYYWLSYFADVSYGYAITAHKSQGSTYKEVYVDIVNINKNQNIVERNRIIYTAITRAAEKAVIIINK